MRGEDAVSSVRAATRAVLAVTWALAFMSSGAQAHEIRPGFLGLTEAASGTYDVMWTQPVAGALRLALAPILPDHCVETERGLPTATAGALTEHWTVDCGPAGLLGASISVSGLDRTLTDVLVRVTNLDGQVYSELLRAGRGPVVISPGGATLPGYLSLGIEHLLFGFDHILLVVLLMVLISEPWPLVRTVTAFTVAHTITPGLSALSLVVLPQRPVEVLIALSILLLAVELTRADLKERQLYRRPWLIAFVFGLLHGFGFAGALKEIGLPDGAALVALLLFNLGVEAGQLLVIGVCLVGAWVFSRWPLPTLARGAPLYMAGSLASYWLIGRIVALG